MHQWNKDSLPPSCKRLVDLMRGLVFGRIENLLVRSGEPVLTPLPRVIREWKFSEKAHLVASVEQPHDFTLKAEVIQLLELIRQLNSAVIEVVEVRHGLPHRVEWQITDIRDRNNLAAN